MVERPILKFRDPTSSTRRTASPAVPPRTGGPSRRTQGERFGPTFDSLADALERPNSEFVLRQNPAGVAPERALVFVTAGPIQNFARAASAIGLEVFAEDNLEDLADYPDGFVPAGRSETLSRTLYATFPTLESLRQLLSLWRTHQRGGSAPNGAAPLWSVFDLLLELRTWGPEDRLPADARAVLEDRLIGLNDEDQISIEVEIWPTNNSEKRVSWKTETENKIRELGGEVLDRSSISEPGFIYEAILASLSIQSVRALLDSPDAVAGLATLEGVQFILPHAYAQSEPGEASGEEVENVAEEGFSEGAPTRALLLDGTPVAAHPLLEGGVVVEDLHDLVSLSQVNNRFHATAMASLILRGDLGADGSPLTDTKLLSVPILIDTTDNDAQAPDNKLIVESVHSTLTQVISGQEPLYPDVFVVNFSVGIRDSRFAGKMSSLSRMLDWWAANFGVLFVISSGNIPEFLFLDGTDSTTFEGLGYNEKMALIKEAKINANHERTLLAPAESLNSLTVGALSEDLTEHNPPSVYNIISLEEEGEQRPQLSSAVGLGLNRMIKPDLINHGGKMEARFLPSGGGTRVSPSRMSRRSGLIAAAPPTTTQNSIGTSPATALTTRAILQCAEALTTEDGPYQGQELPRQDMSLLTKVLALHSTKWPEAAHSFYNEEKARLGAQKHLRAKEEVCKHFGYGVINPLRMIESSEQGATLVGLGSIRKNQARIFRFPPPPSLSGDRVPRTLWVTLAWFSPTNPTRAQYRLAGLEAICSDRLGGNDDDTWSLDLKADGIDPKILRKGSVWSRRFIKRRKTSEPQFEDGHEIPICVQCRDTASNGLSPDDDIRFAIAVSLEIESEVQYDVYQEISERLRVRATTGT